MFKSWCSPKQNKNKATKKPWNCKENEVLSKIRKKQSQNLHDQQQTWTKTQNFKWKLQGQMPTCLALDHFYSFVGVLPVFPLLLLLSVFLFLFISYDLFKFTFLLLFGFIGLFLLPSWFLVFYFFCCSSSSSISSNIFTFLLFVFIFLNLFSEFFLQHYPLPKQNKHHFVLSQKSGRSSALDRKPCCMGKRSVYSGHSKSNIG